MGRFDGVLLASDFDNTLIYTEDALLRGEPIPPLPERNRQALTYSWRRAAGSPSPPAGPWRPLKSMPLWCP